jgi:thiosulfate/3-mercaptopyruvate sulfurtransferase
MAERLKDPSVVVAEIDSHPDEAYETGHVPGAVGWDLHTDMEHQLRRDIPDIAQFETLMSRSGIERNTTVVLYGDGNNRSATWAFWVMKFYGHDDVRIMDGGRTKWTLEGRPVEMVEPAVEPTAYWAWAVEPDPTLRAMKEYVVKSLGRKGVTLLDTRTVEEYAGQLTSAPGTPQPDIYRKGRIPGAVHVPWDDGASGDGTFKSVSELRTMYSEAGIETSDEIISYCRLGVRASYSWFILKYILGFDDVRVYDGSWTEWGNSAGVPIDRDEPV